MLFSVKTLEALHLHEAGALEIEVHCTRIGVHSLTLENSRYLA